MNGVSGFAMLFAVALAWIWMAGTTSAFAAAEVQWSWMKGADVPREVPTYGTLGTPDMANTPGARASEVSWTDASGALWLFGGGYTHYNDQGTTFTELFNDLWKYDPATGNWTWVKGANTFNQAGAYGDRGKPLASNTPGARWMAVSWTDPSGKLWLYGGYGYDSTGAVCWLNDLWQFDTATGNWTWMHGSSTGYQVAVYGSLGVPSTGNTPGGRRSAVSWSDSAGNLWLFGGLYYDGVSLMDRFNDLWKYTPSQGTWTWVTGDNTLGTAGRYGTLGVPSAENTPGAREQAVSWTDTSGNLWLFGGWGNDTNGNGCDLNDLWKFDPVTGYWTWMKGANTVIHAGTYGTLGVPAPENTPGSRQIACSWTDVSGALWLYGGQGRDSTGAFGNHLCDLWKYDVATGNWTWMQGSSIREQAAVYGTPGTPATANTPGGRVCGVTWTGASGALWFFGGDLAGYTSAWGWRGDLWKFVPPDTVPPTGTIVINGNQSATNSRTMSIAMTWSDGPIGSGVARMRFSDDGATWSAYESLTPSKSYTLPVGDDGYRTIRVQFIDKANNRSAVFSDYIRLDRSVPKGGIIINNGAPTTTTQAVTLNLSYADIGSGVVRMRFSDNGSTWTSWMYPKATKAYILPAGLGYHTVRVQYLDGANNYSLVYNDYIKIIVP